MRVGADVIEIRGAHSMYIMSISNTKFIRSPSNAPILAGCLLSSYNSPISTQRSDSHNESFENRIRICRAVICAVRPAIPTLSEDRADVLSML
jgi:2,4-dienoyl-CoA reductase-like NADH-dependent reductase (Old Yellow Enzyme family)